MQEVANGQNIEIPISEWRETGPQQDTLWRLQRLVQAIALTVITGFIGPFFFQNIYNLWIEAWSGRKVECFAGPSQLPTPLENPSDPNLSPPPGTTPQLQEPFSTMEEAQDTLRTLLTGPFSESDKSLIGRCTLAAQLDLSEASYVSRSRLENITEALSLSEIQLPFPSNWNDWQQPPSDSALNPFETLRFILTADNLPANLKITFIFNPPLAKDTAQRSIQSEPLADLFAALTSQESLRLFKYLHNSSSAILFFELFLLSTHRNAKCLPQLQAILSENPRPYLPLFVNQPQYNPILKTYLNGLKRDSLADLVEGMETATLKHLFHRFTLPFGEQKWLFQRLVKAIPEKDELIHDLYKNADDQAAFLGLIITSYPELPPVLIKQMAAQSESLEAIEQALEFFLLSYPYCVCLDSFKYLLGNETNTLCEKILNHGRAYTDNHSPLFVNLCLLKMKDILAGKQSEEEKKQSFRNAAEQLPHAPDSALCAQELAKLVDASMRAWIMETVTAPAFLREFTKATHEINLDKFIETHTALDSADLSNPSFSIDKTRLEKIFQKCRLILLKWTCPSQNDQLEELRDLLTLKKLADEFQLELIPQSSVAFEFLVPLLARKEESQKLFKVLKSFSPNQANLFLEAAVRKVGLPEEKANLAMILSSLPIDELRKHLPILAQNYDSHFHSCLDQSISCDVFKELIAPLPKEQTNTLLSFCKQEGKFAPLLAKLMTLQPYHDKVLFFLFSIVPMRKLLFFYLLEDSDKIVHLKQGILNSDLTPDQKIKAHASLLELFENQPFEKIQTSFGALFRGNTVEQILGWLNPSPNQACSKLRINVCLFLTLAILRDPAFTEKGKNLITLLLTLQENGEHELFGTNLAQHCDSKYLLLILNCFTQINKKQPLVLGFMQEIIKTKDLARYQAAWKAFWHYDPGCLQELVPTIDTEEKLKCVLDALPSKMTQEEKAQKIELLKKGSFSEEVFSKLLPEEWTLKGFIFGKK